MKRPRRIKPVKNDDFYHQMWRLVDGAVKTALTAHPEYLAPGARERTVRQSINKRVVGALTGYVGETPLWPTQVRTRGIGGRTT